MKISLNRKIANKNKIIEETQEKVIKRRRKIIKKKSLKNKLQELNFVKFKKYFKLNKAYYSIFISMIIISVVTIYLNMKMNKNINEEKYFVLKTEDLTIPANITLDEQNNFSNNKDTRELNQNINENKPNNIAKSNAKEESKFKTSNNTVKSVNTIKKLQFVKPLTGKIIKDYYKNDLVYSKTLETWKTHEAVDIRCEKGSKVKASEEGVVEKIYEDSLYGNTIIIKHNQGYKTIYSNVKATAKEGKKVNKNEIIGSVDNSGIIESKDDTHIHFMMLLNNEIIDPKTKIRF